MIPNRQYGASLTRTSGNRCIVLFGCLLGLWLSGTSVTAQLTGPIGTLQENSAKPMRIRLAANNVLDPSPTVTLDNSPLSISSPQKDVPCISRRLPPPEADANVGAPASMRGQIRDGSYENSYFGLTYTPGAILAFNTSKFFADNSATVNSFGLFSAWAEKQIGRARKGAVAYAERLSNYPEGCRDGENILGRYVQNQRGDGYQVVNEKKLRKLGNIKFLEADFRRREVSEAMLLTSRKGYVLVFVFNASNDTDLDIFISSSRITLADNTGD